jgi:hypothetical protein
MALAGVAPPAPFRTTGSHWSPTLGSALPYPSRCEIIGRSGRQDSLPGYDRLILPRRLAPPDCGPVGRASTGTLPLGSKIGVEEDAE